MCMRNPTHIYSNGKSTKLSNLNMTNKPSFPNTDSTTNSTKSTDNYKLLNFSQVEYDSSIDPLNMVQYSPKIYKVTKLNGIPVSSDTTDAINTNTNTSEDSKNNLPSYADLYSQSPPSYELKDFNNEDKNVKNLNDIPLPVSSINDESEKKNSKARSFAFYMFLWFCITWFVTGNFHYESVNETMSLHIGYGNTGDKSSSVTSGGRRGCSKSSKFGMKPDDEPVDFAVDLTKIDNTIIIVD